ncbi:dihydrodipicolinate synthase family protein [Oceanobacillus damuensis]|uniref:dihydrodipicolinate synthase family protein n=1 Tax=Oceanobacillus damuensis TaxID=937928 RepID=UPI000829C8C0|nr:dihydrodipicolinate synthase family protein [Oceanobacillus damuensis]
MKKFSFKDGIIGATITPFDNDFNVDEVSLRKLVEYNLKGSRVKGLVCNAFAGETFYLTSEERKRIIEIMVDQVDGRVPVVAGIWAEGIKDVIRETEIAEEAGADVSLLFQPFSFARGVDQTPEVSVRFHKIIAESTNLPIIAFQTRVNSGTHVDSETLAEISKIDKVIGIKYAQFDMEKFNADVKAVKEVGHQAEILTGIDTVLAPSMYPSDGGLLGLTSATPNFLSELMDLVKAGDMKAAMDLEAKYYDLVSSIYVNPKTDIPARLKQILVELGIIETSHVREPFNQLSEEEKSKFSRLVKELNKEEL